MRKHLVAGLLAAPVALFALSACNETKDPAPSPSSSMTGTSPAMSSSMMAPGSGMSSSMMAPSSAMSSAMSSPAMAPAMPGHQG